MHYWVIRLEPKTQNLLTAFPVSFLKRWSTENTVMSHKQRNHILFSAATNIFNSEPQFFFC